MRRQVKLGTISDHLVEIAILQGSQETFASCIIKKKNQAAAYLSKFKKQYKIFCQSMS